MITPSNTHIQIIKNLKKVLHSKLRPEILSTNRTNTPKTTTSTTSPLKRTSSHSRTISSHKNHREMPTTIGQITTVAKEDLQAGQRFNKQGTRFNY